MGDLRDQLKKAKLLSKKEARRLAHEQRQHRAEVGREGLESERKDRQDQLREIRAEGREQSRRQQAEVEAARTAMAERAACQQILDTQAQSPEPGGRGRWFFALDDGRLPSLLLNEKQRRLVEARSLAIVRSGPIGCYRFGLLEKTLAVRVSLVFPERFVRQA